MPVDVEEKFWKVMRLLGSDHEGEQLAALRELKKMLHTSGQSWNTFVDALLKAYNNEVSNFRRELQEEARKRHPNEVSNFRRELQEEARKRHPGASEEHINQAIRRTFGI